MTLKQFRIFFRQEDSNSVWPQLNFPLHFYLTAKPQNQLFEHLSSRDLIKLLRKKKKKSTEKNPHCLSVFLWVEPHCQIFLMTYLHFGSHIPVSFQGQPKYPNNACPFLVGFPFSCGTLTRLREQSVSLWMFLKTGCILSLYFLHSWGARYVLSLSFVNTVNETYIARLLAWA